MGDAFCISGGVVQKALNKVLCVECRQSMVNKECCSKKYGKLKNLAMLKTMVDLIYKWLESSSLVYAHTNIKKARNL